MLKALLISLLLAGSFVDRSLCLRSTLVPHNAVRSWRGISASSSSSPLSHRHMTFMLSSSVESINDDRRDFLSRATGAGVALVAPFMLSPAPANAIGPVKIPLKILKYSAEPCPKDRPIPGQKAMQGMRGLCVTVEAELSEQSPKELEKVGVYGFVTDSQTSESVLANNPDLSTDAGQFTLVEKISPTDKR